MTTLAKNETTTKIRESKGFAFEVRGRFYLRITMATGKRCNAACPWARSLDAATERAHVVQALVNRLRRAGKDEFLNDDFVKTTAAADETKLAAVVASVDGVVGTDDFVRREGTPDDTTVTFESFALDWVKGKLAERFPDDVARKRSAYQDECNLKKYVFPVCGSKPIATVTLADFDRVKAEIATRAAPRKLSKATRRQILQAMRRVMQLAEYPAKLVARNPIPEAAVPKGKTEIALQFAYPDEDALLMADKRADLGLRVLFGFMHRQGPRRAEVLGGAVERVDDAVDDDDVLGDVPPLVWSRIDLRRGAILPDRNKTDDASLTPIEPDLVRALSAWKKLTPKKGASDPVFVLTSGESIEPDDATDLYRSSLRAALVEAECDRPELWVDGRGRKKLRLHDARASFVTVALVNGRSEDWVRRRSKHKSSAIERYRRQMGTFRELNLGDWVPLDRAIPEIAAALAEDDDVSAERVSEPSERPRTSSNGTRNARASSDADAPVDTGGLGVGGSNPLAPTGSEDLGTSRFSGDRAATEESPPAARFDTFADPNVSAAAADPVEAALAAAIAALAARVASVAPAEVVQLAERMAQLARELEARRAAREAHERAARGNVVALRRQGER